MVQLDRQANQVQVGNQASQETEDLQVNLVVKALQDSLDLLVHQALPVLLVCQVDKD